MTFRLPFPWVTDWGDVQRNFEALSMAQDGEEGVFLTERADAAAPVTNRAVLYARDNGAGKTQVVVRFPTGAIQVLATEP